jgi:hypothetical protein
VQLDLTEISRGHQHGWLLYEARRGGALLFKLCAPPCLAKEIAASLEKNYTAKLLIPLIDKESAQLVSRQESKE